MSEHIIVTKYSCIFSELAVFLYKGEQQMSNLLSYKNYNGTVEYSREDECLYGKVFARA